MSDNPHTNPKRLEFCKEMQKNYPEPKHLIRSKVPGWVRCGRNVRIYEGVLFTQGFGYARDEKGKWLHIPHVGRVIIGDDVDIFPYTTVNRGTLDDTIIGDGTKIDHHCHIGHNSKTGKNCVICAGTVICGSAEIGDNVWIGVHCTILNKARIASDTYVGNQSNVVDDITKEGTLVYGNPARCHAKEHLPHNKIG